MMGLTREIKGHGIRLHRARSAFTVSIGQAKPIATSNSAVFGPRLNEAAQFSGEATLIDHITFGVTDFARSTAFYDRAFLPLGVKRLFDVPLEHSDGVHVTGYGDERPWFWIAEDNATTGTLHILSLIHI